MRSQPYISSPLPSGARADAAKATNSGVRRGAVQSSVASGEAKNVINVAQMAVNFEPCQLLGTCREIFQGDHAHCHHVGAHELCFASEDVVDGWHEATVDQARDANVVKLSGQVGHGL